VTDNLINETNNLQDCRKMDIKFAVRFSNVHEFHISVSYLVIKGLNIIKTVRITVTCINLQKDIFLGTSYTHFSGYYCPLSFSCLILP
jgi:hypothetical protein